MPLSINNSDWTVEERHLIVHKTRKLCDEGCNFIGFNITANYSICECNIIEENNNIEKEIENQINNTELMEKMVSA